MSFVCFVAILQFLDPHLKPEAEDLNFKTPAVEESRKEPLARSHVTTLPPMSPACAGPILRAKAHAPSRTSNPEKHVAARRHCINEPDLFALTSSENIDDEDMFCSLPNLEALELGAPAYQPYGSGTFVDKAHCKHTTTSLPKATCHSDVNTGYKPMPVPVSSSNTSSTSVSDNSSTVGTQDKQWSNFARSHFPSRFSRHNDELDNEQKWCRCAIIAIPEDADA